MSNYSGRPSTKRSGKEEIIKEGWMIIGTQPNELTGKQRREDQCGSYRESKAFVFFNSF
jgi:hypothetical protein